MEMGAGNIEDDAQATVEAWRHSVETGSIYQIEHRIRHADGTFHWYLSRASRYAMRRER